MVPDVRRRRGHWERAPRSFEGEVQKVSATEMRQEFKWTDSGRIWWWISHYDLEPPGELFDDIDTRGNRFNTHKLCKSKNHLVVRPDVAPQRWHNSVVSRVLQTWLPQILILRDKKTQKLLFRCPSVPASRTVDQAAIDFWPTLWKNDFEDTQHAYWRQNQQNQRSSYSWMQWELPFDYRGRRQQTNNMHLDVYTNTVTKSSLQLDAVGAASSAASRCTSTATSGKSVARMTLKACKTDFQEKEHITHQQSEWYKVMGQNDVSHVTRMERYRCIFDIEFWCHIMKIPNAQSLSGARIHFSVGIVWTSPENYSWVLCGIHAFSADRPHALQGMSCKKTRWLMLETNFQSYCHVSLLEGIRAELTTYEVQPSIPSQFVAISIRESDLVPTLHSLNEVTQA